MLPGSTGSIVAGLPARGGLQKLSSHPPNLLTVVGKNLHIYHSKNLQHIPGIRKTTSQASGAFQTAKKGRETHVGNLLGLSLTNIHLTLMTTLLVGLGG